MTTFVMLAVVAGLWLWAVRARASRNVVRLDDYRAKKRKGAA